MSFIGKRKMIVMLFVSMLCMLVFPITIYANADDVYSPQASEYIRSTSVNVIPRDNGKLLVENKLGATRIVDKLGIISLLHPINIKLLIAHIKKILPLNKIL